MYLSSKLSQDPQHAAGQSAVSDALNEIEAVYGFIYSRVGNHADAEDLTQQVALKALPRLRDGTPVPAIRGYLYATARSVLATFWTGRLRLPESELPDDMWVADESHERLPSAATAASVTHILEGLPPNQRRVLELRFLRGYTLREVADEMSKSVANVKVMQLRALRRAAAMADRPQTFADSGRVRAPVMAELLSMKTGRAT